MKFTLVYIVVLVIFSVNGVLSAPKRLKGKNNGVSPDSRKLKPKALPKSLGKLKPKEALPNNLGKSKTKPLEQGIGFCDGKTLSDGTQNPNGSCSIFIQGDIPSNDKMPSTLIISPENSGQVDANKAFDVEIVVANLVTGQFSDPEKEYNLFPQDLDSNGVVRGHTHVSIQALNSDNTPPNSKEFAFFKGVNDQATPDGHLTVTVASEDGKQQGLPAGSYRICAMSGAFSHQPLVMPVAKRGAQDDCIRITSK